jgi:hypothetical protein
MKKIQVLSLFLLLACGQIYGSANAELAFILAYQDIDAFKKNIFADNDDMHASSLINSMKECIAFDKEQQNAIKASINGTFFNGKPIDPAQVAAADAKLQARIKTLNNHISDYKKGGVSASEKNNVHARRKNKQNKKDELAGNQSVLSAQDSINNLRAQNALALNDAIESYIATFGQCYVKPGSVYGSSIVISSDQDKNLAITPQEYNNLVATLQSAAAQFPSIMITLDMVDSDQEMQASISDTVSYIQNMPVSSGSWTSFILKSTVAAAVITATAIVGYNLYNGEDWNSSKAINDAMDTQAGQQAQALAAQAKAAGDQAYNNSMNSSYGKSAVQAAQDATAAAQNAANAVMNSAPAKSIESVWTKTVNALGYQTQAQINANAQLAAAQTATQLAAAQAAKNLADAQAAQELMQQVAAVYQQQSNNSWNAADQAMYNQYF